MLNTKTGRTTVTLMTAFVLLLTTAAPAFAAYKQVSNGSDTCIIGWTEYSSQTWDYVRAYNSYDGADKCALVQAKMYPGHTGTVTGPASATISTAELTGPAAGPGSVQDGDLRGDPGVGSWSAWYDVT